MVSVLAMGFGVGLPIALRCVSWCSALTGLFSATQTVHLCVSNFLLIRFWCPLKAEARRLFPHAVQMMAMMVAGA
jgi:hypothetical protein